MLGVATVDMFYRKASVIFGDNAKIIIAPDYRHRDLVISLGRLIAYS